MRDWGIKTRDDLLNNLSSLEKEGHSKRYEEVVKILDDNPGLKEEEIALKLHLEDYIVKRLFFVNKMRTLIGSRSLRAWDFGRYIYLCREGSFVGLLSEKEAWEHIDNMAKKVEKLYFSWEDFGANYIAGRIFWAISTNEEIKRGNDASVAYSQLINTKNSAWNLPWNGVKKPKYGDLPLTIEDALYFPSKEHRAWEFFSEGLQLYQRKLPDKAIDEFNKSLKLYPGFYYAILYRGFAYFMKDDFRQAIADYQNFLRNKPGDYYVMKCIAEAYQKNNQPNEALDYYQKTIAIDPGNPDGYIDLGMFHFNQKQYQDAIITLGNAEDLLRNNLKKQNPKVQEALYYVKFYIGASYFNSKFYNNALTYFIEAYEGYKNRGDFHFYLGICYLNKPEPDKDRAIECFKKAETLGIKLPQEIKDLIK